MLKNAKKRRTKHTKRLYNLLSSNKFLEYGIRFVPMFHHIVFEKFQICFVLKTTPPCKCCLLLLVSERERERVKVRGENCVRQLTCWEGSREKAKQYEQWNRYFKSVDHTFLLRRLQHLS
jgi:hypothetical protein